MLQNVFSQTQDKPAKPAGDAFPFAREVDPVYVVLEVGRRQRLLKAFLDEADAKSHLRKVKAYNAGFANPPTVMIKCVDLY